jgi:hypothetical protein
MVDYIDEIVSAWKGHRKFADWLVKTVKPDVIVELGVDYGFSTFCFEKALSEVVENPEAKVYGIDLFQGDEHAGYRNTEEFVNNVINKHKLNNIQLVKGDFTEVSKSWNKKINILHIDGLHTYDAVKNDFTNWSPFVDDSGIILFHDTEIAEFGIRTFYNQINGGYKAVFLHSAGLGIYTKNKELFELIIKEFDNVYPIF